MKHLIKRALGRLVYSSGVARFLWRRNALVVFFHRIDDRYSDDPNSASTADFRSICLFLRRHFHVVPLAEIVDRLARGADVGRLAAITFDDGYRDNATVAAPQLRALGLPATFFITTGFLDERPIPWWDAQRGIPSEWMTWDQVRALHADGFTIGAHTVTHPDLGTIDAEAAAREVGQSKIRIEQEIGAPVLDFCYPFGWPQHISAASRTAVVDAGFRSALETGDRAVGPGDDPYRIGRVGVSPWTGSGYELGIDTLRGILR